MIYNIKKLKILKKFNIRNLYGFTNKINFIFKFKYNKGKKNYYKWPLNIKILKILYDIKIKKLKQYFNKFLFFNLYNFFKTLQFRLDFVLYNLNLFLTLNQSKQNISHKHVIVNNKIARRSSYCVKNNDIIHFTRLNTYDLKKYIICNYLIRNLKSSIFRKNIYKLKKLNKKAFRKLILKLDTNYWDNLVCIKQFKIKINKPNNTNLLEHKYLYK